MRVKLIAGAALLLSLGGCVAYPVGYYGPPRGGYYVAPAYGGYYHRPYYGPRGYYR